MNYRHLTAKLIFLLGLCLLACHLWAQQAPTVDWLDIDGAIGPATQSYVERGIEQASQHQAALVILQLDTPGGLEKSMRGIVRAILTSPIPIITYVAPGGARAASAGTYILYASHIAAMAPGTHLGAATPVAIGLPALPNESENKNKPLSHQEAKALSDASAYIRGLAQLRGRNATWGEKAVLQSASLSANEALQANVIDLIAKDIPDLLNKINGRTIEIKGQPTTLHTEKIIVEKIAPDWRTHFLSIITDPNIAYMLMILGIWGLFFEFAHPGYILPGVVGVIALLLALYAFQLLPINYAGLALLLSGIAFMIAEAFLPTFGALGIGGVIAFVIGSIMLLQPNTPGYAIALPLVVAVSLVSAAFFLIIIQLAIRARRKPVVSGREELIGKITTIISTDQEHAWLRIHGELWQARAEAPLKAGQKVKIKSIEGVMLIVETI